MKRLFAIFLKETGGLNLDDPSIVSKKFNKWLWSKRGKTNLWTDNFNKHMIRKWVWQVHEGTFNYQA
jgi:hypothetical protein